MIQQGFEASEQHHLRLTVALLTVTCCLITSKPSKQVEMATRGGFVRPASNTRITNNLSVIASPDSQVGATEEPVGALQVDAPAASLLLLATQNSGNTRFFHIAKLQLDLW